MNILHKLIHKYGASATMDGFRLRITFWGTWLFSIGCEENLETHSHTTMISVLDHVFFPLERSGE